MNKAPKTKQNADGGSMMRLVVPLPVIEPDVPCPKGCDGLCSLSICGLCGNTGWVSISRAEDHARRQAKKTLTVEMRRFPFRHNSSVRIDSPE